MGQKEDVLLQGSQNPGDPGQPAQTWRNREDFETLIIGMIGNEIVGQVHFKTIRTARRWGYVETESDFFHCHNCGREFASLFRLAYSGWAADTVRIGAILPLSGGGAFYGEDSKRAIGLVMDELGGKITIKGKAHQIEPVYYDDGGAPSESVKGLRKLVTVNGVSVVLGPIGASQVNAVLSVNEAEKVLVLAASGDQKSTKLGNKLILRYQFVPYMVCAAYAKELLNRRAKTICILHDLTDWGVDWADSFSKKYEDAGARFY